MKTLITPAEAMLLALCAALLAALAYALNAPLAPLRPPLLRAHLPAAPTMQAAPFASPPLANFSVINERLVFNPLRQPIVPPPSKDKDSAAPPPPPNLVLVGVIIDGDQRLALIKLAGAPFAAGYAVGAEIAGWQLTEIDADA
ncbi:MAG: hypothetical protein KGJ81_17750, partial [Alphaproteobacteria bacterium]|nr:hypothetical protein [Alphaproteobacteria bacterium]